MRETAGTIGTEVGTPGTQDLQSKSHILALDGVRGLAIAGVLAVHTIPDITAFGPVGNAITTISKAGPFGVDLFFVLSGFLITGILLDTVGTAHYFRNFYARRILRLFPLYYCYLALLMTVVPWVHHLARTSIPDYEGNWWWYLTYFANWKPNVGVGDPNLGHFWSLAVEEQFYMFWPMIVLLVGRRRLAWVCGLLIVSATVLRFVWSAQGVYWNEIYRLTVTRWDTIAMGALVALAMRSDFWRPRVKSAAPYLLVSGLGGFVAIAFWAGGPEWSRPAIQTVGATVIAIGFAGLVLCAVNLRSGVLYRFLRLPLLVSLGKYSYGLYVIHFLVIQHVGWVGSYLVKTTSFAWFPTIERLMLPVVTNVAAYYLAKASWRFFESPILKLKRHFESAKPHQV